VRFQLKIHRDWVSKKDGLPRERDSFYDCVAFNDVALGISQYPLLRGDWCIVLGKLNNRNIIGEDGHKTTVWEVSVDHCGLSLMPNQNEVLDRVTAIV